MSGPVRVQLRRSKGWQMPENTIKVDRSGRFGNLYRVGLVACGCRAAGECDHNSFRRETQAEAVDAFRQIPRSPRAVEAIRGALRGRNLACWCPLDSPCHADVLLEIANAPESDRG